MWPIGLTRFYMKALIRMRCGDGTVWMILALTRMQAGGDGGALETRVPAALTRLFQHPVLDWNLFSTKQMPLKDRKVNMHQVCHGFPLLRLHG